MPISVRCPNTRCGERFSANETLQGRSIRCPKCDEPFTVVSTQESRGSDAAERPAVAPEPFPNLPVEFGRYRLLRLLGRGGMGAVYLAEDSQLQRNVALKIPFFDARTQPKRAERFLREARSAASLQHPNICQVFDTGTIEGRPFLTMPVIEGRLLADFVDEDDPMDPDLAASLVRKIALALSEAHAKRIVHRDLKPANIMVDLRGEPVVMDFGLARRFQEGDSQSNSATHDGTQLGTPSYMSPEQVRGDREAIGPQSDIYALGVILFELLTGRTPYRGSMATVMGQILNAPIPLPAEYRPGTDPRLEAVCSRAMAKRPDERHATATEFADDLAAYLARPSTVATTSVPVAVEVIEELLTPFSPPPRLDPAFPDPDPRDPLPSARPQDASGLGLVIAGIVGLVVLIAVLAVALAWGGSSQATLVVEFADAEAEARFRNGTLILSGPDGKTLYALSPAQRKPKVDPGEYRVRIDGADGLTPDASQLTLKEGGKATVRIGAIPTRVVKKAPRTDPALAPTAPAVVAPVVPVATRPTPPAIPAPISPGISPDRRAAEYVLSVGGTVVVFGQSRDIRTVADLPKGEFELGQIWLRGNQRVTDAGLVACSGACKRLWQLDLVGTRVTDAGLVHFSDCTGLTIVDIVGTQIGDTGLYALRKNSSIRSLWLRGTRTTDAGLSYFRDCRALSHLDVSDTLVGDTGLSHFDGCSSLVYLGLHNTRVTDLGLKCFRNCKNLQELYLNKTKITDDGLANFRGNTQLKHLRLSGTPVTDAGVIHFRTNNNLVQLDLSDTKVSQNGVRMFTNCAKLNYLDLSGLPVMDVPTFDFVQNKPLTYLGLKRTKITAKVMPAIQQILPACRIEWDGGTIVPTK